VISKTVRSGGPGRYLDPATLGKLANLELVARCAVEGFYAGLHPSPFHGFSVEYSDHRAYEPGDELRFLDWKMFGRSDKLYIKQFLQETNVPVYILLDSSMSMAFQGSGPVSKLAYGSYLAASLAYLMLTQSDSVSLTCFAEQIRTQIPAKSRRSHLNAILTALHRNKAAGQTRLEEVLHAVAETTHRRGLVLLISDLLEDAGDLFSGLAHLKYLRHDVIVFHTLDAQEIALEYEGLVEFEDLETRARMRAFPQSLQAQYRREVQAFITDIEQSVGKSNMDYCLLNTSEPLDKALVAYLVKRQRMM